MPKISASSKNTKQQILTAYEELTKELAERDAQSSLPGNPKEKKDTADRVVSQTPNQIVDRLGGLRVEINKNIGEIVDKLVEESETLHILKEEAEKIKSEIGILYQIKVQATTLQNLITLKEQERKELENEMSEIRRGWELENEKYEKLVQEKKLELQKQRKRDEEEYAYDLKMNRQKEEDEYKEKRKQAELMLQKREQEIKQREEEFKTLQAKVAKLEEQLETEVIKARKETEEITKRNLETKYNLEQKEIEGEQKVSKLTIENLQRTIKTQEAEIQDSKQQIQKATQQIKDIAVSVIETKKPVVTMSSPKSNE